MCIVTLIVSHGDEIEEMVVAAPECPSVRDLLQWADGEDTLEAMVSESDCGPFRPPQVMFVTPSDEEPTYIVRAQR